MSAAERPPDNPGHNILSATSMAAGLLRILTVCSKRFKEPFRKAGSWRILSRQITHGFPAALGPPQVLALAPVPPTVLFLVKTRWTVSSGTVWSIAF